MVRDIEVISKTCRLRGRVAGEIQCHCDAGPDMVLLVGIETGISYTPQCWGGYLDRVTS